MKSIFLFLALALGFISTAQESNSTPPKTIEFASKDGLSITAHTYFIESDKPMILLCHQAGFNKAEYAEIAPQLNALGYSVMAIDQRSGGKRSGMENKTYNRAKRSDKNTKYIDAEQDILAAIDYAFKKSGKPILLWGSSYSAGLALHILPTNNKVAATLVFSPGDYFGDNKSPIADGLKDMDKPMFVTSAKLEAKRTEKLLVNLKLNDKQIFFKPEGMGKHGSSALWESSKDHKEYWIAVKAFLNLLD